jgi:hypothetical protein
MLARMQEQECVSPAEETSSAFSRGISRSVALEGYCWIRPFAEPSDLSCAEFGSVCDETIVAVHPNARTYVSGHGAIPFHSDHPDVDFIEWHCERQDPADGATLLLDAQAIVLALPAAIRELLRRTLLPFAPLDGRALGALAPVLDERGVFYAPWLEPIGPASLDGLLAFREALLRQTAPIEIRLRAGEALVVDNRRMLHGRRAIAPDSPRRLERRWRQHRDDAH